MVISAVKSHYCFQLRGMTRSNVTLKMSTSISWNYGNAEHEMPPREMYTFITFSIVIFNPTIQFIWKKKKMNFPFLFVKNMKCLILVQDFVWT